MEVPKKQPIHFADCYVLTNKRTRAFITSFLDTFIPNRQEVAKQYGIPQFSETPDQIYTSATGLMDYLEHHQGEMHAIYWQNQDPSNLRGAFCIFTSDGQVILGVYCETLRPDVHIETDYLNRLLAFCDGTMGIIEYEQPAPQYTLEFMNRFQERIKPKNDLSR